MTANRYTDDNGQPKAAFRARENLLKTFEHLLGLCRGLMADNDLNIAEARFLIDWLDLHHAELSQHPIGRILIARVGRMMADGIISAEELHHLRETLESLIGGSLEELGPLDGSTRFGTEASPTEAGGIEFHGRNFVVTGKFAYGPRRIVEESITHRGGTLVDNVSNRTHYVVIGTLGSRDWVTSAFGTKLEKVHELNSKGASIRIIAEPDWVSTLEARRG